ncbi:HNH endonuclease signature motif containing protein [Polyangium sp. 15x6]|uniref:HNH endonuclease n=1 Tax=Polyangium sp. 15x6 TaxID=3042687 RepID=UPI00249B9D90|nr:HNH endonuclease signature motif containing protein [Polyangium sp. 15x6]MDI3286159.1 HNH endonuclease signature motif containing protein [Polyangium sp. 15x6]
MSREHVPVSVQRRVRERARNRCEYCRISQESQEATFHVDHVQPRRDGGPTALDNLALACVSCSLRKGARTSAVEPLTSASVPLYDPRSSHWEDHFCFDSELVIQGKTAIGRATVELLRMNRPLAMAIRQEEALRGRYPGL